MDPRNYQIVALTGLLSYGVAVLGFDVGWTQMVATLGGTLGTQALLGWWTGHPWTGLRSAWISGLSLCLLARADHLGWILAAAVVAILGKFLLRWHGKHVFNPTNLGLAVVLALGQGRAWVSPGQWGSVGVLAFLLVCLGGLVVMRAGRADVALGFLAFWTALLFGRAAWLGDPWSIPWHRLESGSLLLFAFFMISDPRTTPDSRTGRLLFAALVAVGAWAWQSFLYHNNGLIWSLAVGSLAIPVLDRLFPGPRHRWPTEAPSVPPVPSSSPSLSPWPAQSV